MADPTEEEIDPRDNMYSAPLETMGPEADPTNPDELEDTAEDFTFSGVPEGDPVNTNDAIRILAKRLTYKNQHAGVLRMSGAQGMPGGELTNGRFAVAELTRKLVAMIPEEHRTKDFLENMDFRPMLQAVMMAPGKVTELEGTATVRGVEMSQQEQALAAVLLTDETARIQQQMEEGLIAAIDPASPTASQDIIEAQNVARNLAYEWRDAETVGRVPPPPEGALYRDPATGEVRQSGNNESLGSLEDALNGQFASSITPTRFMTREEVMELAQSGDITIDDLRDFETEPAGTMGIDGEPGRVSGGGHIRYDGSRETTHLTPDHLRTQGPGSNSMSMGAREDWYSVRQILRKPADMTRDELMNIHKKLKASGLYELVGGEPVVPGDPTDPAFKAAWKHLATMALEKNKPMTEILKERQVAYQQELNASLAVSLTDPARLQLNADAYARDSIGRKLTNEEHVQLTNFIHDLERRNAKIEAGLDETMDPEAPDFEDVDALDEGTIADIDAQLEMWIRDNKPAEYGASKIADQYDAFTRMLGGPGRGVGV